MNIVLIGPFFPYRGGISDTNQELCESLIKTGHKVDVITFKLQYPRFLFPGKTQFHKNNLKQNVKSIRIINSINPFNWINTSKVINDLNPDLVISCYWTAFLAPCLLVINNIINNKIKKIGLIHNAYPHEKSIFQKTLFKKYLKSINEYVTFSKNIKEEIIKISPFQKGVSLFHPVPEKFGNPIEKYIAKKKIGLENNIRYLLFFGLIREYKGLDILLKSMIEIIKKNSDVKLLIVGENYEPLKKYHDLVYKYKLEKSVSFINKFVNQDEIKYWFCSSELVILPYKNASQSGIASLAIQFEIPIVSSDVGGLSEFIIDDKDGFLSKPDSKELSNKILIALNSDLNSIKKEIKIKKKELTWTNFTSLILSSKL